MIAILITIAIYLASVYAWYKYVQVAFSKEGIYSNIKASSSEVFFMFCPILNTIFSILGWLCAYPKRRISQNKNLTKFFNIK